MHGFKLFADSVFALAFALSCCSRSVDTNSDSLLNDDDCVELFEFIKSFIN